MKNFKMVFALAGAAILLSTPSAFSRGTKSETKSDVKTGAEMEKPMIGTESSADIGKDMVVSGERYAVIDFKKGVTDLTPDVQTKLRTLLEGARASGEVDKVHLAVWSDMAFPKGKAELPKNEKDLAEKRIDKIEAYLKESLSVSNVDSYSLADKANWLARTFNTSDAELKSLFAQRGATPLTNEEFSVIKRHGAPGKAVVVITMASVAAPTESGTAPMEEPKKNY